MKGTALFLSAAVLAALTGCSSKPEQQAETIAVNPVHQERCYSMDNAYKERAGRAYLAEGRQFYFHLDCERHIALQDDVVAHAVKDGAPLVPGVTSAATGAGEGNVANAGSGVAGGGAQANKASIQGNVTGNQSGPKAEAEPTCYSDKMTAGRGDLPPCEWDEEKQEFIKK